MMVDGILEEKNILSLLPSLSAVIFVCAEKMMIFL